MKRSYYFVRHGQAVYQERGFDRTAYPKETDWPLSSTGVTQAHRVAPLVLRFGIERVVSSRLERARHTASVIAARGQLPHEHLWAGLNEVHPTTLRAGRPEATLHNWSWLDGYRAARAVRRSVAGRGPTPGWDIRGVEDRVFGILARLDELPESRLVVTGHGYWILLCSLFLGGELRYRWIDNCSVTRVDADGSGRYRVVSFASVL